MGRRKRSRKLRSANRRARRTVAYLHRLEGFYEAQRDRTEAREAIDGTELPDGVKLALGLLVDPVGTMQKLIGKAAKQQGLV